MAENADDMLQADENMINNSSVSGVSMNYPVTPMDSDLIDDGIDTFKIIISII